MVDAGTGIDVAGLLETGITVEPRRWRAARSSTPTARSSASSPTPPRRAPDGLAVPVVDACATWTTNSTSSGKVDHGWLGVLASKDDADRAGGGAQIDDGTPGSPAAKAGLAPATWSCEPPATRSSGRPDLVAAVRSLRPRTRSTSQYVRDGKPAPTRSPRLGAGDPQLLVDVAVRRRWADRHRCANCPPAPGSRDHEAMTTHRERRPARGARPRAAQRGAVGLPARPAPVRGPGRAARHHARRRSGSGSPGSRSSACCASSPPSSTPGRSATARRWSPRKIDPDRVDEAAAVISAHPGREPQLQAQPRLQPLVHDRGAARAIRSRSTSTSCTANPARSSPGKLPTLKLYKIGVKLDMTGNTAADAKAEVLEHEQPERREHMDAPELSDLEVATIRRRAGGPPARRAAVRRVRPS